jgi:Fic family protein
MNRARPETKAGLWIPSTGSDDTEDQVFVPRPLPSDLILPSSINRGLAQAEQWLGRLDEATRRLPDPAALVRATQIREVQSSASLDDVTIALREVLLADLLPSRSRVNPTLSRYLRASDFAFATVAGGAIIDVDLLVRITHEFRGVADADPERKADRLWRDEPGRIGRPPVAEGQLPTGPPGPHMNTAIAQWAAWTAEVCPLPLVGKLALGHYQLAMLQPFSSGSANLARLYIGLELVQAGVLRAQILPISMWLDRHSHEYQQQIRNVVETADFTDWIAFFSRGINEACRNQVRLIQDLEAARDHLLAQLADRGNNKNTGNIRRVLTSLVATPITNHNEIAQRHGLSTKAATDIAKRLIDAGLIQNMDNKNYRKVFVVPEFMRLLSLNDPPPPIRDQEVFATDDPPRPAQA